MKINAFVENQGVKIHYWANQGEPGSKKGSLLFVPGVMMPAWIWEKQLSYFSKEYNVAAMDPRSQGESDHPTEGHYPLARASDIKAVVDALKWGPIILVCWSLGVAEAVNYAAHYASKELIGLVLIDGLVGIDPSLPFYKWTVDFWTQFQVDRIRKTEEFVKMIFHHPQPEDYLERLTKEAMGTPTNTVTSLMENYILQDFRDLLPKIAVPTLIIAVEGQRLDYMKDLSLKLPDARFEIIREAGHAVFVDQPEIFNAILEDFVEDVSSKVSNVN